MICQDDEELQKALEQLKASPEDFRGVRLLAIDADFVFGTIPTTIRLCSAEGVVVTNLKNCRNLRPFSRLIASTDWVKIGHERDIDHIAFFCGDLGKRNVLDISLLEKIVGEASSTNVSGEEFGLKVVRTYETGIRFFEERPRRKTLRVVKRSPLPHGNCLWNTRLPSINKSFVFSTEN